MKQDNIFDAVQNARKKSLEFTQSVIEQSKKLRHTLSGVDKIGTAIGGCVGVGFLAAGAAGALAGKSLWAAETLSAGVITLISNHYHKKKSEK